MSGPGVLVVGQGGREHAILDALHRSAERPRLYVALAPGMSRWRSASDSGHRHEKLTVAKAQKPELRSSARTPPAAGPGFDVPTRGSPRSARGARRPARMEQVYYAKENLLRLGFRRPHSAWRNRRGGGSTDPRCAHPPCSRPMVWLGKGYRHARDENEGATIDA